MKVYKKFKIEKVVALVDSKYQARYFPVAYNFWNRMYLGPYPYSGYDSEEIAQSYIDNYREVAGI